MGLALGNRLIPQGRASKHALCLSTNLAESISQIPNFPNDPSPHGPAQFGKFGNWEMLRGTCFPTSQMTQPIWTSTVWEIWKWAKGTYFPSQFPNFPHDSSIFQHIWFSTMWEVGKWLQLHISQFPKRPQPRWASTIGKSLQLHTSQFPKFPKDRSPVGPALFGKLGNRYSYILPNFPNSQKTAAQMGQHYSGNWAIVTGTYFPLSQKTPA